MDDEVKTAVIIVVGIILLFSVLMAGCIVCGHINAVDNIKTLQAKAQIERCKLITDKTYYRR